MSESQEPDVNVSEIEAEATSLGWTPKESWHGDPNRWVDAQTYVDRSATVLPIVQRTNKAMKKTIAELQAKQRATDAALRTIEETKEADLQAQLKATKADIARQLTEARAQGDDTLETELIEKLTDVKALEREAKKEAPLPSVHQAVAESPEFIAWKERTPQFESDPKFQRRAYLLAEEIYEENQENPERAKTNAAFYAELDRRYATLYATPRRPQESKVEGGRPRGESGNGRSYQDLPAEARAVCDQQAKKFVGADRAFKDAGAWRAHYTAKYFEQE